MEKEEKGRVKEKTKENSKENSKESSKEEKKKSVWSFQAILILLLIVIIALILIVVQVPYTTTNAIKEQISEKKCSKEDIPFIANFRTGFKYKTAVNVPSSEGLALYKYSDLDSFIYANIRNTGKESGIYCINAAAYLIEGFEDDENALTSFQKLILADSDQVQELQNWASARYTYPVCTENAIRPIDTSIISLWGPSMLSDNAKESYDLDKVYILVNVVAPTVEKCAEEDIDKETEEEVTRYCNAWKHVVGRC